MHDGTPTPSPANRKSSFITFSTTRCAACGRCVEDCVGGVLAMRGGRPQVIEERSAFCVRCGHCVSVCPENAITLDGRNSSELRHVTDFCMGEAGLSLLRERRAIRRYSGSVVNEELLREAIYYAGHAPTAHNYRQVEYIVINGRNKVEALLQRAIRHMEKHDICMSHVENVRQGRDTLSSCCTPRNASFPKRTAPSPPPIWNWRCTAWGLAPAGWVFSSNHSCTASSKG